MLNGNGIYKIIHLKAMAFRKYKLNNNKIYEYIVKSKAFSKSVCLTAMIFIKA